MRTDKYDLEASAFREKFLAFLDKRIVLYGIGRRTMTLLPRIHDFNIVGLLDRDEENIGREFDGVKVISLKKAETKADLIVINSDSSNYKTIFRRIADVSIPVYYSNGIQAKREDISEDFHNDYSLWKLKHEDISKAIDTHQVISFDVFDTLIARKVMDPSDIFEYMEDKYREITGRGTSFKALRQMAVGECRGCCPTIENIYDVIKEKDGLSADQVEKLLRLELDTELRFISCRQSVIDLLIYAISSNKTVIIVSDMYWRKNDIRRILSTFIDNEYIPDDIFVSCDYEAEKEDGSLWDIVLDKYKKAESIIHIGDNLRGDIEIPRTKGIDCFHIPSCAEMMGKSVFSKARSKAYGKYDKLVIGMIGQKLFSDPFLRGKKGKLAFGAEMLGYCIYGPIVMRYLNWMLSSTDEIKDRRIIFLARDGYLVYEDYKLYAGLLSKEPGIELPEAVYLPISRRIVLIAAMPDMEAWREFLLIPYIGSYKEYLNSRFNVFADNRTAGYNDKDVISGKSAEEIEKLIEPYKTEIEKELKKEKECYIRYLENNGFMSDSYNDVLMDLGCQGTNQYYLQKVAHKKYEGRYFYANLRNDNVFLNDCKIQACFQHQNDPAGEESSIRKKSAFLESFFTAPYGMVRYIDGDGKLICEPDKMNQKRFADKDKVNGYIKEFIGEWMRLSDSPLDVIGIDTVNAIYDAAWGDGCTIDDSVAESFYFDNDMIGSDEQRLLSNL